MLASLLESIFLIRCEGVVETIRGKDAFTYPRQCNCDGFDHRKNESRELFDALFLLSQKLGQVSLTAGISGECEFLKPVVESIGDI